MSERPNYWRDTLDVESAKRILGAEHFDYVVSRGPWHCETRQRCAWEANDPEHFAAYGAAARFARTTGAPSL